MPEENGKVQLKVYVPAKTHKKLKKQAKDEGITMGQIVEELIEGM